MKISFTLRPRGRVGCECVRGGNFSLSGPAGRLSYGEKDFQTCSEDGPNLLQANEPSPSSSIYRYDLALIYRYNDLSRKLVYYALSGEMKILIDGYNLIFAWGWMPANGLPQASSIARNRMIEKLKQLIPLAVRRQFTMVFDVTALTSGQTRHTLVSGIDPSGFHIRFAHDYADADTLIEELILKESTPNRLVVVSTDQRLRTAAQRRKAISIRSEDFLDVIENILHQIDQESRQNDNDGIAQTSKQQAIEGLKGIDWLAEFGISQAELDENKPADDLEPRAIKDQLNDLIDFKTTRRKRANKSDQD